MDKAILITFVLALVLFTMLIVALHPSKPTDPIRIYFYDANGNPDGWGEVRL